MRNRRFWGTVLLLLPAASCCPPGAPSAPTEGASLERVCKALVVIMGDPTVDVSVHHDAERMLIAVGTKEALGALAEAVDDKRIFDPEAAPPSGNPSVRPGRIPMTVGGEAKLLLPEMIGCDKFSKYRVSDWRQWWQEHRTKSFEDIRAEVERVNSQK